MDFLLVFFRDVLDGIWYYLYLLFCIFMFFYVLGIVADRKRLAISQKLKEKKTYDIESGREAKIAAMESKQVLAVGEDLDNDSKKEEEVPSVMVFDSNNLSQTNTTPQIQNPTAPVVEQPNVSQQ